MALGYGLLHPSRIEMALDTSGNKRRILHESGDAVFGGAGVATDLGPGVTSYFEARIQELQNFGTKLGASMGPSGPLAFLTTLFEGQANIPDFSALFNQLVDGFTSLPALKERIRAFLHALIEPLP